MGGAGKAVQVEGSGTLAQVVQKHNSDEARHCALGGRPSLYRTTAMPFCLWFTTHPLRVDVR